MKLFFTILLVSNFFFSFAQKQDYNWCFGDSAGINFNTSPPTTFQSSINSTECATNFSDRYGNLLFYAGGNVNDFYKIFVWSKDNTMMQNGNYIYGHTSVTNGVLVIPFNTDTNKFYVFHIYGNLYKSIVDLSFNNGLGKVILKNSIVYNTQQISEKLTAIRHANGRDWWLILHQNDNNTFVKFLIANDVIFGPFLQSIGSVYATSYGGDYGEMEVSADGDKIAATNLLGVIDLFDFDRCTGELSNWLNLSNYSSNYFAQTYGCSFSSKGTQLYITKADSLFQFDLTSTDITGSMQTIWVNANPNNQSLGQMQLAPDGKIYVANVSGMSFPNNNFDSLNMNLSVINFPNSIGVACDFQPYSFSLNGRRSYFSLPNIPNYNLGSLEGSECDTLTSNENSFIHENLKIYPNPTNDLLFIESIDNKCINIQLINNKGQLLETIKINSIQTAIDLDKFPVGLYILKIISKNGMTIKKIIKT